MRNKLIVLTTILGLIAFSGVAAAAEETGPEDTEETGDTTFNYGYDEENGVFIWGSSASDGEFDCTLENGSLRAIYDDEGGSLLVEDLLYLDGEGDTTDSVEFDEEGEPIAYTEVCELNAGEVAGPQGQINHGMFLKTFNAMFDGKARGCMVRHIAQSDLGKDDQQVNVSDGEEESVELVEENSIDFKTVMTDCVNGPDENGEAEIEGEDNGKGRPGWVTNLVNSKGGDDNGGEVESQDEDSGRQGPPDHARGKGPKG